MTRRPLAAAATALAAVAALSGCGRPPHPESGFDRWTAKHVTVLVATKKDQALLATLHGLSGGYDPVLKMAVVDADAYKTAADGTPVPDWFTNQEIEEAVRHEQGHALLYAFPQLREMMPGPSFSQQQEQGAQCIALLVTGHLATHTDPAVIAAGYWQCPQPYARRMLAGMALLGVAP
jgi:hypothetical protein